MQCDDHTGAKHHSAIKAAALDDSILGVLGRGEATQKQLRLTVECGSGTMSRHIVRLVAKGVVEHSSTVGRAVYFKLTGVCNDKTVESCTSI